MTQLKAIIGVGLLVAVELVLWSAVSWDFESPPRDGYLWLVNGTIVSVAVGFGVLTAWIAAFAAYEARVASPERARVPFVIALAVLVGVVVVSRAPLTDALARHRGLTRCEPLDELRKGNVSKNDVMARAYVKASTTPADVLARCGR